MPMRGWPAWARVSDILDLLRLSGPIAVSRASIMLMSLTDVIVLGQNAPKELPFVLNAWLPIGVSLGLGGGLLLGVSILTAELSATGKVSDTGRVFRRGFWFSIWFGGLLTLVIALGATSLYSVLGFDAQTAAGSASVTRILAYGLVGHMLTHVAGSYLEALRRPGIVTTIMYVGVVANLVVDLAFVAGWGGMPQLGADGVALATTGTRWVLVVVFLVLVWKVTPAFRPSETGPPNEARRQMTVGFGSAISNIAEWGGFNFTFIIATWISLAVNTVYGMSIQVVGLCFMEFLGLGTATSVRVAEAYGRRDVEGVRNASRLGVVACVLVASLLGVLVWLLRDVLASVLAKPDALVDGVLIRPEVAAVLGFVGLIVIFDGMQNVSSMALRAQNVTWLPSVIHLSSYFGLMIPLTWFFGLHLGRGAQGMMEGVFFSSVFAGLGQTLLLELKTASQQRAGRRSEIS